MAKPKLPVDVNTNVPSIARMYDFSLGGNNNFTVDRIAAEKLNDLVPGSNIVAKQNREFLIRVTTALAQEHGIRQFLVRVCRHRGMFTRSYRRLIQTAGWSTSTTIR